jgi:hypothetical protein
MGAGIGGGVWYYRVSAIMAADDPNNPGGETLPSDPLALNLPSDLDGTLVLTLFWSEVPGAQGYRVYRSPTPDLPTGSELLLAEITGGTTTSYEDVSGTPAGDLPRPLGATGVWMSMSDLGTEREAAGVTVAKDPTTPDLFHIYAIGGRPVSGPNLTSYEYLSVTAETDGTHTVASWMDGTTNTINGGRAELSAYSVSHSEAIRVPVGTTYVYAGGGEGSRNVDAAVVQAGGQLAAWEVVAPMSPQRWGYAAFAGGDFLFAFGGQMGSPDDGGNSAELETTPPLLTNWNNEGERMLQSRYQPGGVVESAFMYVVGGQTDTGPTNTTERTVL